MPYRALVIAPVLMLLAACEPGAMDAASDGPVVDPSANAPLGEAITEPTDGLANEIEAD